MKTKNKKASIPATMTWVVAVIIIVFILFLYLVALTSLFISKGKIGVNQKLIEEKQDFINTETAIAYLNSEIENVIIPEYIEIRGETKDLEKFTQDFFKEMDEDAVIRWRKEKIGGREMGGFSNSVQTMPGDYLECNFKKTDFESIYLIRNSKITINIEVCIGGFKQQDWL